MSKIIVIGSSTGGPKALGELIGSLPKDLPVPIIIAQHILSPFENVLVDNLTELNTLCVFIAEENLVMKKSCIYVIPGGYHFFITGPEHRIKLIPTDDLLKPSIDMCFTSVAEHYGPGTIGVVLTGVGHDGTVGAKTVKQVGGTVLVQDGASSTVNGMPMSVVESGFYDEILPLNKIAQKLVSLVR